MARGLNKVMIIGHLGRDPEMRYTPNGRPVTSFSVATTRTWTSAEGERREETEWLHGEIWLKSAKRICRKANRFMSKGACKPGAGKTKTARSISAPSWLLMK
jgi:single-strand DNA-binding protein